MVETQKTVNQAKREFDEARESVNNFIRTLYHGAERDRWLKNEALDDLYYSQPTFSQVAGYMKRAEKVIKAAPELEAALRPLAQAVVDAGAAVAAAKYAETADKVRKQQERDAKKAYRGDNNLILAMALPRAEYRERAVVFIGDWVASISAKLAENNWDLNAAFPFPGRDDRGFKAAAVTENRKLAEKFFGHEGRYRSTGFLKAVRRENVNETISTMADEMTERHFGGYILKLSGKIGTPVKHAKLEGSLWQDSTLHVDCENGTKQVWSTKCIFNRSCLGKVFNQWPTRRAA